MPSASARRGRRRLALVLLAGVPACGLFRSEPQLPPPAEIAIARARDASEWELLRSASVLYRETGPLCLPDLRQLAAAHPESVRLGALVQDVEMEQESRAAVFQRYLEAAERAAGAPAYYLAARAAPERERALELVGRALELDPDLVPARVLQLGHTARLGNPETLDELVKLLRQNPGSAEGWRLLARLAPLYARNDLYRAAADTEPWSPQDPPRWARLSQAQAALRDEDPEAALRILADLPAGDREARLLQAAALTAAGQPWQAKRILEALVDEDPADPLARFNLGLLALDYLDQPELAQEQLREFLRLADAGAEVPLTRRVQAGLWLERLAQGQETASP